MKRRTVNKAVSTAMALMLSAGAIGAYPINNIYAQDGINVLSDSAYSEMVNENTNKINENYVRKLGDKKYSLASGYKDGTILFGNGAISSSYAEKTNLEEQISLTSDTTLTYVDENGINHVISNKQDDGTAKYDKIYSSLTGMFYNYTPVEKDGKVKLIDKDGKEVKLGTLQSYDDIQVYYTSDGNQYYGLCSNTSDEAYDFTLVKESGEVVFSIKDCNSLIQIGDKTSNRSTSYLLFKTTNEMSTLIDLTGKVWYEGVSYKEYHTNYMKGIYKPWVILEFEDSYGYYNRETGKAVTGAGNLSIEYDFDNEYFYLYDEGQVTCYDENMNKLFTIQGNYKKIEYYKGCCFKLTSENGELNFCGIDGELLFPKDITQSLLMENNNDVTTFDVARISSMSGEADVLYYKGNKIDISEIKQVADDKFYSLGYTKEVNTLWSCLVTSSGVVLQYYITDLGINVNILITKESNFKNAVQLKGDFIIDTTIGILKESLYAYENVNKSIMLNNGTLKECKYKLSAFYDVSNDTIKEFNFEGNIDLYVDNNITETVKECYSEDGKIYYVNFDKGEVVTDKNDFSKSGTKKEFGDTGYYYFLTYETVNNNFSIEQVYAIYNSDGEKIESDLSDFYKRKNIQNISMSNDCSDLGFIILKYKNNETGKYESAVYSYKGEKVLEGTDINYYVNKSTGVITAILSDGTAMLLKEFDNGVVDDTITGIINDTDLKIDELDDIETPVISGIQTGTTVNDIKQKLGNENIQICDKAGNIADASSPVGTGSQIQLLKNGQVIDTAVVVVKGDTDGTGTINILDMEAMQKSILGINKLTGVYKSAALLNDGEQNVSVLDMETVQKDILGIKKIVQ